MCQQQVQHQHRRVCQPRQGKEEPNFKFIFKLIQNGHLFYRKLVKYIVLKKEIVSYLLIVYTGTITS